MMGRKHRILIVDDNPRARRALSAFLSTLNGFKLICEASNGADAIEKVEDQTPDVILMDIEMPVMDGLRATAIIKERWPRIKVIILTLHTDYAAQARQAGADAFLVKGCSMEEMTSTLRSGN